MKEKKRLGQEEPSTYRPNGRKNVVGLKNFGESRAVPSKKKVPAGRLLVRSNQLVNGRRACPAPSLVFPFGCSTSQDERRRLFSFSYSFILLSPGVRKGHRRCRRHSLLYMIVVFLLPVRLFQSDWLEEEKGGECSSYLMLPRREQVDFIRDQLCL